jgi:signal transduction histidine kinase
MNNDLIHDLREALLKNTSRKADQHLFDNLVQSIVDVAKCDLCSLWGINNNNTPGKRNDDVFQSISIISRKQKNKDYPFQDLVLKMEDTFIQKTIKNAETYYEGIRADHKQKECLEELNLNFFIGIPIPDFEDSSGKIIAVLKLSYTDSPKIENKKLFAEIIRDYISSSLYRRMLLKKQDVMKALMDNYEKHGQKRDLCDIFTPILKTILYENCCEYEGASFFIWDSYMNYYTLLSTNTDITLQTTEDAGEVPQIIKDKKDYHQVFYQSGDGLTGQAAEIKESMIYDDLSDEEKNNPQHLHRSQEITTNIGKTMMVIPVFRPSKPDEIIGILRLVNKRNKNFVDYFNDTDEELVGYACKYLALTIDYFLAEEERNNFISKLSHEFSTPANTIRITANRLLKNKEDKYFMHNNFDSYMEAIFFFSELQIQQATTNLYVSKARTRLPKSQRYMPSINSLKDIIHKSKSTVIPIAREARVKFDNIIIESKFPAWNLYVDYFAFTTVFYNLLTNTIKYHNSSHYGEFYVNISGYETSDSLIINVSDFGLGIEEKDKNKIFLMGVRGKNVTKKNVTGFGIGLPVIKQIINDFGGEIRVSNLKSPTKFEIKLPKYLLNDNYTKTKEWNS